MKFKDIILEEDLRLTFLYCFVFIHLTLNLIKFHYVAKSKASILWNSVTYAKIEYCLHYNHSWL